MIRHNFPFIDLCWLLTVIFLSSICLEMVPRISCSITFLGIKVRLTSLWFPNPPSIPFCTKGCTNCWAYLLLLWFVLCSWLQCYLVLIFGQQQWHVQLIHYPHDSVNLIHTPCSSLLFKSKRPRLFPWKATYPSIWPIQKLKHIQLWFYCVFFLKSKKKKKIIKGIYLLRWNISSSNYM